MGQFKSAIDITSFVADQKIRFGKLFQ